MNKKYMEQIKKYISILLIALVMTVQNVPFAIAQEVTTESTLATETMQTSSTEVLSTPSPEPTPDSVESLTINTDIPTDSVTPTPSDEDDEDAIEEAAREEERRLRKEQWLKDREARRQAEREAEALAAASQTSTSGSTSPATGGDISVETGDSANTAIIESGANNNLATIQPSAAIAESGGGVSVANTENGSDSTNSGSAVVGNTNDTEQYNSATVNSNLDQSATTGSNDVSGNTGGDSSIETGDANVSGTVITTVNTNAAGVMVSEFNVNDDHVGDLVLDFAANCVSGCGIGDLSATNMGNGTGSSNDSNVDVANTTNTFQNNDANIGNELILTADSGNNTTSKNTDGDSSIKTGDANVSANVLTMANNNVAGNVIYGVVNIFGDLIGDILLTDAMMNACCGGTNATAVNTGNGSDSTNSSNIDVSNSDSTFQNNDATITNNLILDTETGGNSASKNTGGDSTIQTGDTTVDVNILNIANSNILGGNMWLVIVNEAGNWVGKILGAPAGYTFAGAEGSEFMVDENGYITAAINSGNGADSSNNASVSETNTNTTTQNNDANVENNLTLSANTGGNTASQNTGGASDITTGDANIVANLVNFVNNNISGNGKLFVTVINVFGSWMGDFVAPGQQQEEKTVVETQDTLSDNKGSGDKISPTLIVTQAEADDDVIVTSKKTKKIVAVSSSNEAVMGASDENDSNSGGVVLASNTSSNKVKGTLVKEAAYDKTAGVESQGMTLNLAWFLILGPLGIIALIGKKYLYRKVLPTSV